jgi:hypothetical protein
MQSPQTESFYVILPLEEAEFEQKITVEGTMTLTPMVKFCLGLLRCYNIIMIVLLCIHILRLAFYQ